MAEWDPKSDPEAAASDPFKTLFVGEATHIPLYRCSPRHPPHSVPVLTTPPTTL